MARLSPTPVCSGCYPPVPSSQLQDVLSSADAYATAALLLRNTEADVRSSPLPLCRLQQPFSRDPAPAASVLHPERSLSLMRRKSDARSTATCKPEFGDPV